MNARINALGASANAIFAGTDAGIFVSINEGRSWRASGEARRILAFANLGRSVLAGTDQGLLRHNGSGWTAVANFPTQRVRSLLAVTDRLFVGTDAGEVLATHDEGQTWSSAGLGLPKPAQIFALASTGSGLFAALYANGLYRWTEAERRWRKTGPLSPLVLASSAQTLIAGQNPGGLHFSDGTGAQWSVAAGGPAANAPVWALVADGATALAGASNGTFVSKDSGRSWMRATHGLPPECPCVSFLMKERYLLAGAIIGETKGSSAPAR